MDGATVNYHDHPQPQSGPSPSASLVLGGWFAFTAVGLAGYLLFRRSPSNLALILLAAYSGSGLVGIGHYLVPGATSMPWWRQAHVSFDIACGIAVFTFALWAARARRHVPGPGQARHEVCRASQAGRRARRA